MELCSLSTLLGLVSFLNQKRPGDEGIQTDELAIGGCGVGLWFDYCLVLQYLRFSGVFVASRVVL